MNSHFRIMYLISYTWFTFRCTCSNAFCMLSPYEFKIQSSELWRYFIQLGGTIHFDLQSQNVRKATNGHKRESEED
jgi:hypothetical protein